MFMNIKQRKNGKTTVYIYTGYASDTVLSDILSKSRNAGVSIRPLRSGKIAIDIRNTPEGIRLVTEILRKHGDYEEAVYAAYEAEDKGLRESGLYLVSER
ncbi:hypothetical protein NST83_19685 [Paenibacillus sp. FSL R10-2782]|uniref:hypothetical protein n=1 Tax=Paenibacillus sp. FSL R10-2782 TaxID=2954661 RepID=UPI0031585916